MAVKLQWLSDKRALLQMKQLPKLEFKEDTQNGFIRFGKDNIYPSELVRLYDEHPEHRSIINRKARYIFGKGIKAVNQQDEIKVNNFINTFNRFEDLNKIGKKLTLNTEIFNGCYVQVITNLAGIPIEYYVLNSAYCRLSEDTNTLFFCKEWKKNTKLHDVLTINKFVPNGKAGTYFIEFKYYTPSSKVLDGIYPKPQYQSAVDDVNTDIDISTFNKNYVGNGFSVGTIISFFNGTPLPDMIQDINNRFKGTYTGEDGDNVLITHGDQDSKAPVVTTVGVEELAEKFAFTSKRCREKIFIGHEIASELFNIKLENSFLSASPDLSILQNLFVKGYIEPRQNDLLEFLSYLSFLKTGEYLKMEFESISDISFDLSNDADLTQDERRELKGYEPLKPIPVGVDGKPLPIQASETNDALTGLSATQNNDVTRIVHQFNTGKNGMNEALATARLKAYGLTDAQVKEILGTNKQPVTKMSSQVDKILVALEMSAEDDNDDEVIEMKLAHIHNSKDALKLERQVMRFADALNISIDDLDSAVLNALKGNPLLTVDEIATQLNYDSIKITESLARLNVQGLIEDSIDGFIPTEKASEVETKPIVSYETYTVYKYAVNPEKPSLKKGGSSRPFCSKMLALSLTKSWTFEKIDAMENDLGTNVWDYRGGYYTNPVTKEIDPDCRHLWMAIVKRRKVK